MGVHKPKRARSIVSVSPLPEGRTGPCHTPKGAAIKKGMTCTVCSIRAFSSWYLKGLSPTGNCGRMLQGLHAQKNISDWALLTSQIGDCVLTPAGLLISTRRTCSPAPARFCLLTPAGLLTNTSRVAYQHLQDCSYPQAGPLTNACTIAY